MCDYNISVDCRKDGTLVRTYTYTVPGTAVGPPAPPPDEVLEGQAKSDLATERLAFPPYEGFKFNIRRD